MSKNQKPNHNNRSVDVHRQVLPDDIILSVEEISEFGLEKAPNYHLKSWEEHFALKSLGLKNV